MPGLIAIVGRPNVGKSALFNRVVGRRIAIVHDQPGVTRDRISAEAEWEGRAFTLVDTGGIGLARGEKTEDVMARAVLDQVQLAIDAAHLIFFVVDVREGVVPLDREVAEQLRASGKPVWVVVNKVDSDRQEMDVSEFAELGFEQIHPVSATHGSGVESLMESALSGLPAPTLEPTPMPEAAAKDLAPPATEQAPLKLAIIGRPNVGKSSLINALSRSERVIVSDVPGTTRDAVDVPLEVETDGVRQHYLLIDTAGLRKTRRVGTSIEFYSVKRAEASIARCDLAVLVLDAQDGVSEQDKKIAGKILEEKKACIVAVNKWDLYQEQVAQARREKPTQTGPGGSEIPINLAEFARWVQETLFFIDYAPVIFTSAHSGFHLERMLEAVRYVTAQMQQKIPTALLNRTLYEAIERQQPISTLGHRLRFFYATQIKQTPPTFVLFVNRKELFSDQYTKYLTKQLRAAFGFEGCPIQLVVKPRPKSVQSIRSEKPSRKRKKRPAKRTVNKKE